MSHLTSEPLPEEWQRCQELAQRCNLTATRLTPDMLDLELLHSFPSEVLHTYRILPLQRDGFRIRVAMADPLDVAAEDVIRSVSGCQVERLVALEREILAALDGRLGDARAEIEAILRRIPDVDGHQEELQTSTESLAATAPVIQLVSSLIGDAIRMRASDIHIEPQKATLRVRYRLDGSLKTMVELPHRVQSACVSRIKLMAGLDIAETRKPQDGRTRAMVGGREVDLRVSSLPTFRGEKLVLRILDPNSVLVSLDQLGFQPEDYERLSQVLAASQGMLLCTGPTGSGKTSTLYSALVQLNVESDNIVTVEDPIEYQLEGVNQVQVNVRAELTFASALRSILRQDPDVVLIGEIRDLETAEIAVQAAQTGHLVLSTLHTNDAVSTLGRLVLMGVPVYLVASSLLCVLAQRLVRRLCPHCRKMGSAPSSVLRRLAAAGVVLRPEGHWVPVGCEHCRFVGYKGRMGLFELLLVSDSIREALLKGASEAELERLARSEGMHTLLEDGLAKCEQGLTSLEELLRVVTPRPVGQARLPAVAPPVQPGDAPARQRPQLLFVSRDAEAARELAAELDRHGFSMKLAGSPEAALQASTAGGALAVVDGDLPDLDAARLIQDLRPLPVILLTSAANGGLSGLDSGADEFLLKPLDPIRLMHHVEQLVAS